MRPKAEDALQPNAAKKIREAMREVRSMKGLTNEDIADALGWELRKVTNALSSSRMLRVVAAKPILLALYEAKLQTAKTQKRIESAAELLVSTTTAKPLPPMAAALIPTYQIRSFAAFLADQIAKKPGVGKARRDALERDLRDALWSKQKQLAKHFLRFCFVNCIGVKFHRL